MREDAQSWLSSWFASRAKITRQTGNSIHTDYFEAGWLTSMEVVEFVTDIETQFNMQFSDSDLQDSRFVTIAGLTELILARSSQMSESR